MAAGHFDVVHNFTVELLGHVPCSRWIGIGIGIGIGLGIGWMAHDQGRGSNEDTRH